MPRLSSAPLLSYSHGLVVPTQTPEKLPLIFSARQKYFHRNGVSLLKLSCATFVVLLTKTVRGRTSVVWHLSMCVRPIRMP